MLMALLLLLLVCLLFPYTVKLFFYLPGCFHHRNEKIDNKPVGKIDGEGNEDVSQHAAKLVKYETLNKLKDYYQAKSMHQFFTAITF